MTALDTYLSNKQCSVENDLSLKWAAVAWLKGSERKEKIRWTKLLKHRASCRECKRIRNGTSRV